jgi:hypothetical protein
MFLHERAARLALDLGSLSFDVVEAEIKGLLVHQPDLPRAHLLRALNCALHRDQVGASAAHHTYFDFAVRQGGPSSAGSLRIQEKVVQGALLGEAALHWHFGQFAQAAAAVEEGVRLAQENGDGQAIALALAWLHQAMASQGHPRAALVLRRCMAACAEQGIRTRAEALSLARHVALSPALPGLAHGAAARDQLWSSLSAAVPGDDAEACLRLLTTSAACSAAGHSRLALASRWE